MSLQVSVGFRGAWWWNQDGRSRINTDVVVAIRTVITVIIELIVLKKFLTPDLISCDGLGCRLPSIGNQCSDGVHANQGKHRIADANQLSDYANDDASKNGADRQ